MYTNIARSENNKIIFQQFSVNSSNFVSSICTGLNISFVARILNNVYNKRRLQTHADSCTILSATYSTCIQGYGHKLLPVLDNKQSRIHTQYSIHEPDYRWDSSGSGGQQQSSNYVTWLTPASQNQGMDDWTETEGSWDEDAGHLERLLLGRQVSFCCTDSTNTSCIKH